jgi:5'-deoxynucleotidase YfbR-like HD superfamily hydrolase
MNLTHLYVAGQVQRWHQNPTMAATGQTLADHQGRCVQLLLFLKPDASPALIRAVAFHDVGEFAVGDLSGPFKDADPELAGRHAAVEARARAEIVGPETALSPVERDWLNLIDRLEAAAYVLLTRPWEAERKASGWPEALQALRVRADALKVGEVVRHFLGNLEAGRW